MSATYDLSARPPWALVVWTDDNNVFTEVPCKDGPPLIQKYPLTDHGLGRALNFLKAFHKKHQPTGGDYKITLQAKIKKPAVVGTDAQREQVRSVLKRLKIT